MATDYSKKTNAELVEILKSRSLPHTGKKADLVARIQQDDETKSAEAAPAPAAAPAATETTKPDAAADDVIDWDDDVPAETAQPSTEASATAIAAGGKGPVANPVAVPNQELAIDPATTNDLNVESTGGADTAAAPEAETAPEVEKKPAVDYTRGLAATDLEAELAKRKKRAEKFGIVEDDETALKEAQKQLDRAKRFGTGAAAEPGSGVSVKGLDEALPNERARKRGRNEQGGRGGKRRDVGRNRNRRGDGNQNRNAGGQNENGGKSAESGQNTQQRSWGDKDRLAMEARKKRFAAAN
ncbi:putative SAP domain protein [Penicillium brasilianum]|uniref:Putative SAP domain protein n=1 Tax=Penicillium brasilianum TaxID=104259 RepID=A0A1S9RXR9_PENBI|nr:putative SAP domain protein [Penicillium brasilianum]